MTITNPTVAKVFDDLEKYRDWCRFEGKVFNENALYNKKDANWQAYEKYRNWLRAKNRNKERNNA
jgi:CRISPR/Cas system CSM-associated protein Csm5 (group 7 of RAMP superfamily)